MPKRILKAARIPTAINLKASTAEIQASSSALEYQKRAMRWVNGLQDHPAAQEELTIRVGAISLNIFDALKSELKAKGGQALANVEVARALKNASTSPSVLVYDALQNEAAPTLNRILADENDSKLTRFVAELQEGPLRARAKLFRQKRRLQRLRNSAITLPKIRREATFEILAVPREPAHIHDIAAVEEKLRENHGIKMAYVAWSTSFAQHLEAPDRKVFSIGGNAGFSSSRLRRIRRFINHHGQDIEGFDRVQAQALGRAVLKVLNTNLGELFRFAKGFLHILKRTDAKLLMVGNPYTMEGRTASLIGKSKNLSVVAAEHGSILAEDPNWESCILDKVFVWGAPSKRSLLSCGLEEDQIEIAGSARLDRIVEETKKNMSTQDPYVLVASSGAGNQVSENEHRQFIATLFEAAKKNSDLTWLVKLHKKDRPYFYLEGPSPKPDNLEIVQGDYAQQGKDIFHYLRRANALLTIFSTAALDAMLVDVPVITFDLGRNENAKQPRIEFIDRGGTYRVRDATELANTANQLSNQDYDEQVQTQSKSYVKEHYQGLGNASETIAKRVSEILRDQKITS